jgi:hypothetical protein
MIRGDLLDFLDTLRPVAVAMIPVMCIGCGKAHKVSKSEAERVLERLTGPGVFAPAECQKRKG